MAANRMDPGKSEGDKGERHAESAGGAAPRAAASGMAAWAPLIGAVVLLPLVAYGVTTFILLPKLQQGLGLAPASTTAAASGHGGGGGGHGAPAAKAEGSASGKIQVPVSKIIVNVSGTMGSRFLMASMILVSNNGNFANIVRDNEAQLKDTAGGILAAKTIQDLEKPGARNLVRSELITAFNHVLGGTMVQEIYFTDFAIQ